MKVHKGLILTASKGLFMDSIDGRPVASVLTVGKQYTICGEGDDSTLYIVDDMDDCNYLRNYDEHFYSPKLEFVKADTDKNRLELLEPEFILGIGKILTFGAIKYDAYNWQKADKEGIERIKGAMFRHMMAYLAGTKIDPDSGESHLYHIGCNLMFLDYFDRMENTQVGQVYDRT